MSDSYQAVYDAVRSRISGCDIGSAVERAIDSADFGGCAQRAMQSIQQAAGVHESPSAVYRPALAIDGNQWCALYGLDLQSGVAGFGDSPAAAMWDFDKNWYAKLPVAAADSPTNNSQGEQQ